MSSKRIPRRNRGFGDRHPRGPQYPLEVPEPFEAHLRLEDVAGRVIHDSRREMVFVDEVGDFVGPIHRREENGLITEGRCVVYTSPLRRAMFLALLPLALPTDDE